ncbi:GxxExxY protein [Capnocytophaga stomatis]|uniref:GxxExxY protein n=2 Tax=Capnocytophaga stomatis TaxID=1848904 RepID=A0ABW8QB79_9FLAO
MTENEISYKIRGAIYNVYNELGVGLLESVYTSALHTELLSMGLYVEKEVYLPVYYKDTKLDIGFRLDLLVEKKVIIEVKSVEEVSKLHHKQLLNYLKLTDLKLGILINFNECDINEGIFRKINSHR